MTANTPASRRAHWSLLSLALIVLTFVTGTGIALSVTGQSAFPETMVKACLAMMGVAWSASQYHLSVSPPTTIAAFFVAGSVLWAVLRTGASLVNTRRLMQQSQGYAPGRHPTLDAAVARPDFRRLRLRLLHSPKPLAFTIGLWRPQVIVSDGIASSLSEGELRAVLFHELAHVRSRDPLRLAVAQFLAHALWFLPVARPLARDFVDAIEEGADDRAVMANRQPLDLASALVKTAKAGFVSTTPLASSLAGNLSVEDRVKRLLGMDVKRRADTTMLRWVTSGLISLVLLTFLVVPLEGREAAARRAMKEAMMRIPRMTCSVPVRQGQ